MIHAFMTPEVSIVIPSYNSENTIIPLVSSIYRSQKVNLAKVEVVMVDDHSSDKTAGLLEKFKLRHRKLTIRIVILKKNKGPARARNVGARNARGRVLFFLDSDVILYKNSLYELFKSFDDPDIHALTGVWDRKQKKQAFFPKFKALRDWSYWINERDPKHYYYLFSTRVAAIDRGLFLRLGGFDEGYKAALVEDIELTYRIARRYAVVFNPKVKVHHEFEDFIPIAKKYFWRSFYWSKIYRERKKFDPVATTGKEALTTISAGTLLGLMILWIVTRGVIGKIRVMGLMPAVDSTFLALMALFLVIHLWGVRKFLGFCYTEEGIGFAVKSFVIGFILYIIILSGAIFSMVWYSNFRFHR